MKSLLTALALAMALAALLASGCYVSVDDGCGRHHHGGGGWHHGHH